MKRGSTVPQFEELTLPPSVVSRRDLSQLVLEAERIDGAFTAADVRRRVSRKRQSAPVYSEQLTQFLEMNGIALETSRGRSELIRQLRSLKQSAPVIHMTFAASADIESLQHIAAWLREEIHPQAIVEDGVQPALVAGVHIRTANKVHDLSLRSKLKSQRALLVKELEAARG